MSTNDPSIPTDGRKINLTDLLKTVIRVNGSDLHLEVDSVPMIRVDGRPRFLDCPPIAESQMVEFLKQLINDPGHERILQTVGSVDIAYALEDGSARFRVNIFHSRQKFAVVMRRIITRIPTMEELNLPPQIAPLAEYHRGLIIVSGTTGSGKSTTLASILGTINRNRSERIITIEDPIEYQHENAKSMISQVEVGTDSENFETALRSMMRQDPDTILIGEIRDSYSLSTALRAADTGHLVFTTVHAANASMTVERMVSLFDPAQKELQQTQLALNLIAVVCMRLAKKREGRGRVPVCEVMMITPFARKCILDGEYEKLKATVGNKDGGSQSFDQHLVELFQKQIIDVTEARRLASNSDALNLALRGISSADIRK